MLAGTKKLFGNDYIDFCKHILLSAEYDELPAVFKLNDTFGLTFQDIADLYNDVKKDTGFEVSASLYMCDECKTLHLNIEVDYSDREEDEDNKYLQ